VHSLRRPVLTAIAGWSAAVFVAGMRVTQAQGEAQMGSGGIIFERTVQPGIGDRFSRLDFTLWLPEPGRPVRAVIIHQHGCGNSSATTNPPVARDFHWQALARKHDAALLVPHYTVNGECAEWNDPDSGSERALLAGLKEFAQRAGRPELGSVPWVLWGHSGGSSWAVQMILRHPGRVLAASLRGGAHKQFGDPGFRSRFAVAARDLPLLFVWGRDETDPKSRHFVSWEPMQAMYRELRKNEGRVALAIDPRTEHHCGDSRLLILPFFDAVLSARLAGVELPGAWANVVSRSMVDVTPEVRSDPGHVWLPTQSMARRWREFSETGRIVAARGPSQPPLLAAAWVDESRAVGLRWRVEPELDGGLRAIRIYRDRVLWREIGAKPGAFLVTNRDSPPAGLHVSALVDDSARPGTSPVYTLAFVDAAGTESAWSAPVTVRVPSAR